jgi:hypothetical protein
MAAGARLVVAAVLDAYDFGQFKTIVDVGGGNGALLAGILGRHHKVRGVLFDQPHVVSGATVLLEQAGVADRVDIEAGDFFVSVPPGGDCYLLKWVVHDWEDDDAVRILRTVRAAMTDDATLVLVERELGPPNTKLDAKLSDINMLVGPGGQERTAAEYTTLLATAGFRLTACIGTPSASDVITALPA